jgi:hypothetical protein
MYLSSCTEQKFKAHLKLIAFILTMIKKVQNKVSINKLISTCLKTDQFLSQADELQVKFRILDANFLRFGVLVPWFSHHFAEKS